MLPKCFVPDKRNAQKKASKMNTKLLVFVQLTTRLGLTSSEVSMS